MLREYFYRQGKVVSGPVTRQQLLQLVADGTLRKSDHIKVTDQDKWHVVGQVNWLCADIPAAALGSHSVCPPPQVPASNKDSATTPAQATGGTADIEGYECNRRKRHAALRRRLALWGGAAAITVLVGAMFVRQGGQREEVSTIGENKGQITSERDDPTFRQWKDVLSTCTADPDYILTDDDVFKCMRIYQYYKQIPTFASNKKCIFNILAGCYSANREMPREEWKYVLIQKWGAYWDESPHCQTAEAARKTKEKRRAKNAQYVRKSMKTPPFTGAFTRQEVYAICEGSTAEHVEFEITVAVDYRTGLRGSLRSPDEVKEMMCAETCDFWPGDPDQCCECESAVVDFVFHQKGWE